MMRDGREACRQDSGQSRNSETKDQDKIENHSFHSMAQGLQSDLLVRKSPYALTKLWTCGFRLDCWVVIQVPRSGRVHKRLNDAKMIPSSDHRKTHSPKMAVTQPEEILSVNPALLPPRHPALPPQFEAGRHVDFNARREWYPSNGALKLNS